MSNGSADEALLSKLLMAATPMLLLHDVDLLTQSTNALIIVFTYISCNHFLYMFTAPAISGPLLRLREPFQQGYHPSYGTVCPPCREALTKVGAASLKSLLRSSSSRPLLHLKSCGLSLQHQCTDPCSNAVDFACPGKAGGPHTWVWNKKYTSILKG